jgi:imidazolonepropionase-like amidohydrolase
VQSALQLLMGCLEVPGVREGKFAKEAVLPGVAVGEEGEVKFCVPGLQLVLAEELSLPRLARVLSHNIIVGGLYIVSDVVLAVEYGQLLPADPAKGERPPHRRTTGYSPSHAGRLTNLAFRHTLPQMTFAAQVRVIEETLMKLRLLEGRLRTAEGGRLPTSYGK